jgi:hypothetical protein
VSVSEIDAAATEAWLQGLRLEMTAAESSSDLLDNPLRNGTLWWDLMRTLAAVIPLSTRDEVTLAHPLQGRRPCNLQQARTLINAALWGLGVRDASRKERAHGAGWQSNSTEAARFTLNSVVPVSQRNAEGISAQSDCGINFYQSSVAQVSCKPYSSSLRIVRHSQASGNSIPYDERLAMVVEDIMQGKCVWELLTHVRVTWHEHAAQQKGERAFDQKCIAGWPLSFVCALSNVL